MHCYAFDLGRDPVFSRPLQCTAEPVVFGAFGVGLNWGAVLVLPIG